jgi:hypothetical protein
MKNFEQNLTESSAKFIHVGSNTYINTQGQTEVCRKGQRGEYCKRHHVTSFINSSFYRNQLSKIEARTAEKLSPFENAMSWLYSVLMKTTLDEARSRYIEGTAMYSMLDMQAPDEQDVKGLQKALLKLIDTSRVEKTKMDKLKELVKNMTLGKGFTIAGYYALKDMTRETLRKFKIGAAGAALAGTMALTGCSTPESNNLTPGMTSSPSESIQPSPSDGSATSFNTSDGRTPAEGNVDQSTSILTVPKTAFLETIIERRTDEFGEYAVTKMSYPSIDSVDNKGVSKAVLTSALEFYTDFVSTEVLDSIALDNYSNYDKWVKEVAPKYVSQEFFNEVVASQSNGKGGAIVFNNHNPLLNPSSNKNISPVLMRDGGPRIFNKHIWDIKSESVSGGIYIYASGAATIITDDSKGADWFDIAFGTNVGKDAPFNKDGKPQVGQLNFGVGLTLVPDGDSWKIAGYSNSFSINNAEFAMDAPQSLLSTRDNIK